MVLAVTALASAVVVATWREEPAGGPTIEEKIAALRAERASLQARADGEIRLSLLPAFRAASLLTDALAVRSARDGDRAFDRLPEFRRRGFVEADALNGILKDALERPGKGARQAALEAAERVVSRLEGLAGDDAPLVLSYTPLFVPPRRSADELTIAPDTQPAAPKEDALPLAPPSPRPSPSPSPSPAPRAVSAMPRYAPAFAAAADDDPPVQIEIVGGYLAAGGGPPPVLAVGAWRGEATVAPGRLRFAVPRAAFGADARRTAFVVGTLSLRRVPRVVTFQLLFTVLPDRPGSFAFDQRVLTTTFESNTLVSPEILARAPAGETRTVRRCFDPPEGWRFDKERQRVVIVERLGWQDDISDATLNAGSVEFAPAEEPGQICIAVIARPVVRGARTATIGRFEATLVRDRPIETVIKSGIRALDWREPARMPFAVGMVEWKLYVRLFDEIDREFDGRAGVDLPASIVSFLRVSRQDGGHMLVLQADPSIEP